MAAHPDAAWLGRGVRSQRGHRTAHGGLEWVVDPIDGTVNFLYDLPGWSVSIARRVGGQVVAGAVAVPTLRTSCTRRPWGAARGSTTSRVPRRRLAASACDDLSQALVATGFAYDPRPACGAGAIAGRPDARSGAGHPSRRGGVGRPLLGGGRRVDAYFERGLQPWDRAAGALIARGGRCRRSTSGPDGSVVACGPALRRRADRAARRRRRLGLDRSVEPPKVAAVAVTVGDVGGDGVGEGVLAERVDGRIVAGTPSAIARPAPRCPRRPPRRPRPGHRCGPPPGAARSSPIRSGSRPRPRTPPGGRGARRRSRRRSTVESSAVAWIDGAVLDRGARADA